MNRDTFFQTVTTLLITKYNNATIQGTGFFVAVEKDGDQNIWVVTNRHMVLPVIDDEEVNPDKLIFHLRKKETEGLSWMPAE